MNTPRHRFALLFYFITNVLLQFTEPFQIESSLNYRRWKGSHETLSRYSPLFADAGEDEGETDGFNRGERLPLLSDEDAAALREEAAAVIDEKIASGIEDINRLRSKMKREMEQTKQAIQFASELKAKEESDQLLNKIDKLTNDFLKSTESSRESTKLAAAASQGMESIDGTGNGLEMGSWGVIDGKTVVAGAGMSSDSLLGSVDSATLCSPESINSRKIENRILVIADQKQDPLARAILPRLVSNFEESNIPSLQIDILSPTSNIPLGGNGAACAIIFCTSISEASSLRLMLERLLRRTLSAAKIEQPPTQLVGISTVGTERTDKFPYSMENLLGRKLEKRRQLEEVIVSSVQNRVIEPSLDYSIIKLGDTKGSNVADFRLQPGDSLDGTVCIETVSAAIVQAVGFQPFARNTTFCVTGAAPSEEDMKDQLFWDKAFLCLEGPEIWRAENVGGVEMYGQLLEYIEGWADILAESGKGLTTPVQAKPGIVPASFSKKLFKARDGVQLLFKPTATGKNYISRSEEKALESEGQGSRQLNNSLRFAREGGVDIVVELSRDNELMVRARRCNYAHDAVIKEISEQVILKRLEEAILIWKNENM